MGLVVVAPRANVRETVFDCLASPRVKRGHRWIVLTLLKEGKGDLDT